MNERMNISNIPSFKSQKKLTIFKSEKTAKLPGV